MADITICFGHGLRGLLPSISGTVGLFSLWENGLEGNLPELHINHNSTLLVYGNAFSCKLPRHYGVNLTSLASLSLIGNHFAQPRCVPKWIMPAEQPTDMFCRSNQQSQKFIMLLFCGGCCFILAAIQLKRKALPKDAEIARARSAWHETCQQQNRLVLASCVLLPFYSKALWLACTVVADHLRFHVVGRRVPLELQLVAFLHLWFYLLAASFHDRHETQNSMRMTHPPRKAGHRLGHHENARVYRTWMVVCVLTSVPGILYSMVKAVPGFLQVSDLWRWVLSNAVALFSGLLTGFGLDLLAGKLSGPKVDRATLNLVGLLFSSILLPGLVTILCHADCLGAWASFWTPCRDKWPLESKFRATFQSSREGLANTVYCDLVSRSDACGWRWRMNRRECMDATLEHLVWLLYPKFAHYTFTIAAFRIVKGRLRGNGMTLQASYVLLKFLWHVVTLFGPCLPILNTLVALLAHIYSILLFGTDTQVLDVKETEEHGVSLPSFGFILDVKEMDDEQHGASLPGFGFSTVAFLALAVQSSNLL